jgi:hypothetical protein
MVTIGVPGEQYAGEGDGPIRLTNQENNVLRRELAKVGLSIRQCTGVGDGHNRLTNQANNILGKVATVGLPINQANNALRRKMTPIG